MANDFYVFLPSNSISPEFPNNTTSRYSTSLPTQLELGELQWEVALVEITYPHTWFNILTPHEVQIRGSDETIKTVSLPAGFYSSTTELLNMLNYYLRPTSRSIFHFNRIKNKVTLDIKAGETLTIPRGLSEVVGFDDQNSLVSFSGQEDTNELLHAAAAPDLARQTHNIFIYSDIVRLVMVGNGYAPLLRLLPTNEQDRGKYVTKEFIDRYYMPLSSNYIKQITIDVRDDQGSNIRFTGGKVTVVLHFRPKQHKKWVLMVSCFLDYSYY